MFSRTTPHYVPDWFKHFSGVLDSPPVGEQRRRPAAEYESTSGSAVQERGRSPERTKSARPRSLSRPRTSIGDIWSEPVTRRSASVARPGVIDQAAHTSTSNTQYSKGLTTHHGMSNDMQRGQRGPVRDQAYRGAPQQRAINRDDGRVSHTDRNPSGNGLGSAQGSYNKASNSVGATRFNAATAAGSQQDKDTKSRPDYEPEYRSSNANRIDKHSLQQDSSDRPSRQTASAGAYHPAADNDQNVQGSRGPTGRGNYGGGSDYRAPTARGYDTSHLRANGRHENGSTAVDGSVANGHSHAVSRRGDHNLAGQQNVDHQYVHSRQARRGGYSSSVDELGQGRRRMPDGHVAHAGRGRAYQRGRSHADLAEHQANGNAGRYADHRPNMYKQSSCRDAPGRATDQAAGREGGAGSRHGSYSHPHPSERGSISSNSNDVAAGRHSDAGDSVSQGKVGYNRYPQAAGRGGAGKINGFSTDRHECDRGGAGRGSRGGQVYPGAGHQVNGGDIGGRGSFARGSRDTQGGAGRGGIDSRAAQGRGGFSGGRGGHGGESREASYGGTGPGGRGGRGAFDAGRGHGGGGGRGALDGGRGGGRAGGGRGGLSGGRDGGRTGGHIHGGRQGYGGQRGSY
eukprot:jgi/Chrzof1/4589/Cz14g19110.t1